jgi:hypothetical protein
MLKAKIKPHIEIPANAQPWEKKAAETLKKYLLKSALSLKAGSSEVTFFVGDTETARQTGISAASLQDEEWIVKAVPGGKIILCGGGTRGTLYSVYIFLEEAIGIRWFTPLEEYVPPAKHLDLSGINLSGRPFFRIRNVYRRPKPAADRGRFASIMRLNQEGEWPLIAGEYGSGIDFGSPEHCHTMELGYMPSKKHFRKNPHYYALIDGKRNADMFFGQHCLSNPDLLPILKEKLKGYILSDEERAKKRGHSPPKIYDISLNDSRSFCQCPECSEKVAKYGESGTLLLLLNQVAAMLKEFRPGYFLQTLAYFSTTAPPRGGVKPLDNIIIRTCNTETFLHQSVCAPINEKYRRYVQDWAKISQQLFPWEYAITYGSAGPMPYPSEFTLAENLRFYADNNAIGIFFEHENPQLNDMYDLKVYMEAKLMENPRQDEVLLMEEFYRKYYGKAAPYILQYRQLLRDCAINNQAQVRYFFPAAEDFRYIDWQNMIKMQGLLSEALAKVSRNPVLLHRCKRACASLDYALVCGLSWWYRNQAQKNKQGEVFAKLFSAARKRLFDTFEKSVAELRDKEKRETPDKYLSMIAKREKRSSLRPIFREDLINCEHEYFTPDCWRFSNGEQTFHRSQKASSGIFNRIVVDSIPENKLVLTISQYDVSAQTDPALCSRAYKLADCMGTDFAWLSAGEVELTHDNLLLSVISRHLNGWRFAFLRDQHYGKKAEIMVETRVLKGNGKTYLDLGAVMVVFKNDN